MPDEVHHAALGVRPRAHVRVDPRAGASEANDANGKDLVLTPAAGTEITIGDYVARYLQPAPSRD